MLNFVCKDVITLQHGVNYIGFLIEVYDENNMQLDAKKVSAITVTCSDLRVDVSKYGMMKIDSNTMNVGDEFIITIHYQKEELIKKIKIGEILPEVVETEKNDIEMLSIEEQILEGVNLLIELQADLIGGAI